MTYREAVEFGTKCLTDAGVPDAALDAWYLLQMVCKIERSYYYVHGEEDITQDAQKEYEIAVQKRAEHIPLQYIIGEQEFMGLRFKVNSNVLIPRQDTETLCEEALSIGGKTLLDLCCGTGCIGVSLAKLGGFEVTFGDISRDCLALARENAALNGIGKDRYTVLVGDVLSNGALRETLGGGYDVVVANIVADVIIGLAPMVRQFLKPGGLFLCSGIIDTRAGEVADALRQNGWEIETTRSGEGWYSYACR